MADRTDPTDGQGQTVMPTRPTRMHLHNVESVLERQVTGQRRHPPRVFVVKLLHQLAVVFSATVATNTMVRRGLDALSHQPGLSLH